MPKTVQKTLSFPLAGVKRMGSYRRQERPYAAPWAMNVRGGGALEGRVRGGSRPGLVNSGSVTVSTQDVWQWPNGATIQWPDASSLNFDYLVKRSIVSGTTYLVDPSATIDNATSTGDAPPNATVNCIYRDRVIKCKNNIWYASRMGDYTDWDYGANGKDVARAVSGTIELAGQSGLGGSVHTGLDITAAIPFRDKFVIFATANKLRILNGDPTEGSITTLDEDIGIIAPYGWAFNNEDLAFLSNDGVYIGKIGSRPVRFSEDRIPGQLKNVDVSANTVTMAYDPGARGFHLFITPASGTGEHYFLDVDKKAIWPVTFGDDGHQPVSAARVKSESLERVIVEGRDGTWREFDDSATSDDDGTAIESHVLIGPIRMASDDMQDALLAELHGIIAVGSANVTWRVVVDDTAEAAVDAAVADIVLVQAGSPTVSSDATGTWVAGRNYVTRPRARGAWLVVWISSTGAWAYEAVAFKARQLGRLR